jgi:heat shock protein HtpX
MALVMFLLGLLYVGFISALIAAGVGAVTIVVIAGLFAFGQLFFSDKLALASMGAREVGPEEAPELHDAVERLCQLSDLPKPKIAVADTDIPNAFATGRSQKASAVCVTTGLMRDLDRQELEGVLAHELSHIANRDVIVMTVASFLATVTGLIIRFSAWGQMGRSRDNTVAVFFAVLLVSIVVYALSYLLLRALSRYREYAADRGAAIMTGAPARLASALAKISGDIARIPDRDLRTAEALNAFFIIPAHAKGFSLSSLFATHPPTEERIRRLLEMQAEIDARPVLV